MAIFDIFGANDWFLLEKNGVVWRQVSLRLGGMPFADRQAG
jgi:hypothetical protein